MNMSVDLPGAAGVPVALRVDGEWVEVGYTTDVEWTVEESEPEFFDAFQSWRGRRPEHRLALAVRSAPEAMNTLYQALGRTHPSDDEMRIRPQPEEQPRGYVRPHP